jgi:hypothetical protein
MGTIRFCGLISGCRDRGKMPCDFGYFVMPMKATRLRSGCGYLFDAPLGFVIDAPLGFGDRDPPRAGRRTDRSYVVPPCVRLGGDGWWEPLRKSLGLTRRSIHG